MCKFSLFIFFCKFEANYNCVLFLIDVLRLLIAVALVIAIADSVNGLFDEKKEIVLGPNKEVEITYVSKKKVKSSYWLEIRAPRDQRIDIRCSLNFFSRTPKTFCTGNIFYYNIENSKEIHGAQFVCNTNGKMIEITSRVPINSLKAPSILIGNILIYNLHIVCCDLDVSSSKQIFNFTIRAQLARIVPFQALATSYAK